MANNATYAITYGGNSHIVTYAYGTCSTAAGTAAKTVTVQDGKFALADGARITVRFTTTNTAANPTLNVQSTGAKAMYYNGSPIAAGHLIANKDFDFVYYKSGSTTAAIYDKWLLVSDLTNGNSTKLTAAQIVDLKAKIKAEAARRKYYGSLSTNGGYNYAVKDSAVDYSSSTYNFSTTPTSGNAILAEHGQKTIDILLKIKDYGDLKKVAKGDPLPGSFNSELITYVNNLAKESITGSSSSCRGACTGLCVGTCASACSGCSSTNGSNSSTGSYCSGCSATCGTGCSTGCGSGCADGCTGQCTGCTGCSGCSKSCATGCSGCQGCGAACSAGCGSTCT